MSAELRTLILSPWMAPHRIAPWQQAVVLAVVPDKHGELKADVLEVYEARCDSPSVKIQIPSVMRLRKEMRRNKKGVTFSRNNVYARDGYRCCYCPPETARKRASELTMEHVIPRSRWTGPISEMTNWGNIVTACKPCNARKDNRTPLEAGMRMHYQPFVPRVIPMTAPIVVDVARIPEQWKPYLRAMLERTG